MQSILFNQTIPVAPKIIHYVWLGSPLPEKYLREMLKVSAVAKRSGFEVNLWVDKESNFEKSIEKFNDGRNPCGIKVRNIGQLRMNVNKKLFLNIDHEMIGLKNYGSASDLLRYEILRQEGGYYFDTDTKFENVDDIILFTPDVLPYGLKVNVDNAGRCGNDVMASEAKGKLITEIVKESLVSYKDADDQGMMDHKRGRASRLMLTVNISGPGLVSRVLQEQLKNETKYWTDLQGIKFYDRTILGRLQFAQASDKSWVDIETGKKSFEVESIPSAIFNNKLKR